jgi:hypothetical protein
MFTVKRSGVLSAFLAAMSALLVPVHASADRENRPAVMVLGTFHFQGSQSDAISVTMGDVTSPRRQAEVKAVIARLRQFAPTKIAVELPPEHEVAFNEIYKKYKSGEHKLSASESQQIGMRLAKELGHEKLYAVDFRQDMDMQRVFAAGGAAGQTDQIALIQKTIGDIESGLKEAQSTEKTILEALRFHNGPLLQNGNGLYLQFALLGTADDPAGAEVVGGWYERNLKIYANIARLAETPKDRILVIYGSGHAPHLTSFFDQNPEFELVPAMSVLGE